jgi:type III secretory pathway component EscV
MSVKAKTLTIIAALGIVDAIVPGLPILALVLVYVIIERPVWFARLYHRIYD